MRQPTEHYQDGETQTTAKLVVWLLALMIACLLGAFAALCAGCVSQTITVHSRGAVYLNATAEKPVTVSPRTTGVPGL